MRKSTTSPSRLPLAIAILALDGAVYSSIIGPLDVFSVAGALQADAGRPPFGHVRVLRAGRRAPRSFNHIRIHTDGAMDADDRFDVDR